MKVGSASMSMLQRLTDHSTLDRPAAVVNAPSPIVVHVAMATNSSGVDADLNRRRDLMSETCRVILQLNSVALKIRSCMRVKEIGFAV